MVVFEGTDLLIGSTLGQGVEVLKELICNGLYFLEGVVVLKELIFNSVSFWRVWWS